MAWVRWLSDPHPPLPQPNKRGQLRKKRTRAVLDKPWDREDVNILWSPTQHLLRWVIVPCTVHTCCGVRFSFYYAESLCCAQKHIAVVESGSAKPCWVCGVKAQHNRAEFVETVSYFGVWLSTPVLSQMFVVNSGSYIDLLWNCWLIKRAEVR